LKSKSKSVAVLQNDFKLKSPFKKHFRSWFQDSWFQILPTLWSEL